MRVAVTGARGFIGGHLVDALTAEGHDVVRLGRGAGGAQVDVDRPDPAVALPTLLDGVDVVVHLAGRTVDRLDTPLSAYLGPNVGLTEDVLLAAHEAGVGRVVIGSSRLVYAPEAPTPTPEDAPIGPTLFYGLSKSMAEQVASFHRDRSGQDVVVLRLAQVVGPGDEGRGSLPRMVRQALEDGTVTVHGEGRAVRDLVHVDDVVALVLRLLEADRVPPVLNAGSGRGAAIADLAREVAAAAGASVTVAHHEVTSEDTSHHELDITLARRALDWAPTLVGPDLAARLVAEVRAAA